VSDKHLGCYKGRRGGGGGRRRGGARSLARGRHRLVEAGARNGTARWRWTARCEREGAIIASRETHPAAGTFDWSHIIVGDLHQRA
jgi:hypothetical protein